MPAHVVFPAGCRGGPAKELRLEILFHCDDVGATPQITHLALLAWRNGWLDGFSIFGNALELETVSQALRGEPTRPARLAAHLNLTVGWPLTSCPLLTGPDGQLRLQFPALVLKSWARDRHLLRTACRAEWRAQLERVRKIVAPRPLTALDSHLHVHMIPWLFELICELAQEAGVPEVRVVREPLYLAQRRPACVLNLCKLAIMAGCLGWNARTLHRSGLDHPDAMLGLLFGGAMSPENIRAGLVAARRQGCRRVEVLTHVGRAHPEEMSAWSWDPASRAFCLSAARDAELEAVRSLRAAS